jgi:septal ring factor EnvC (AmiA/AmiB activator)
MNPSDIHRDLGRMEGRLDAVEDRLSEMKAVLERIDERLAKIESAEAQRKGGLATLIAASSVISLIAGWVIEHFGSDHHDQHSQNADEPGRIGIFARTD